jgi:hypothetical protein
MRDSYMPVTPKILEDFVNQALQRVGESRQVGKMWVYRFEK